MKCTINFAYQLTAYLQALVDNRDNLHQLALGITDDLGEFVSVTSEMVLLRSCT